MKLLDCNESQVSSTVAASNTEKDSFEFQTCVDVISSKAEVIEHIDEMDYDENLIKTESNELLNDPLEDFVEDCKPEIILRFTIDSEMNLVEEKPELRFL